MEQGKMLQKITELKEAINLEFVGKEEIVSLLLVCLLAEGHALLEDVPGIGKTTLAKVLAGATGLTMGRIQFTPDTQPSDVTGVNVYRMQTGEFQWNPGPVMNQLVLADEINRTSPKTQAGLMEVMAEGQVSVDGKSIPLPKPFMVIATENPVEFTGTYLLPEAQLDRFMMRLSLGYPGREQELAIARMELSKKTAEETAAGSACVTAEEVLELIEAVKDVTISDSVLGYAEDIIAATRAENRFRLGGSTRAMLALVRAAQAHAFLQGRDFVKPDDVKTLVQPVLAHRMVLSVEARRQHLSVEKILTELLTRVRIPV